RTSRRAASALCSPGASAPLGSVHTARLRRSRARISKTRPSTSITSPPAENSKMGRVSGISTIIRPEKRRSAYEACEQPSRERRTPAEPACRLLVGLPRAQDRRLVEGAADDRERERKSTSRKPARHRQRREPEPVERPSEARKAPHLLDDLVVRARRDGGDLRRRLGNRRRDEQVHLREDRAEELLRAPPTCAQGLEILVGGDVRTELETRAHHGLDLLRPLAQQPLVDRNALRPAHHARGLGKRHRVRHPYLAHPCAERAELTGGLAN